MVKEQFSLDTRVYKKGQDFSLTYRELLNLIKNFNEVGDLPSKTDLITRRFGSICNDKKFVRKRVTDMLNILKRKGYIKVLPVFDGEGRYFKNTYQYVERD